MDIIRIAIYTLATNVIFLYYNYDIILHLNYPAGESVTGCSCIVSSPSLLKAAPAAVKISPTYN